MKGILEAVPVPDEQEAETRAWQVVKRAFVEREPAAPAPRPTRGRPVTVAIALGLTVLAVVAVAATAVGSQIVHSVRQAVGLQGAAPALTRLPAGGRLLVMSAGGPWIVQPDGSKRLLGRYSEASWSPHGLFVAVTRKHELLAVDPLGNVHWSLTRAGAISRPRWSPDGYRIAYLDGFGLRVVAGDGTGDRLLAAAAAPVAAAWRPSTTHEHLLAFATAGRRLELVDVDTGRLLAAHRLPATPRLLLWSPDGRRLVVVTPHELTTFGPAGNPVSSIGTDRAAAGASFVPGSHRLTVILRGRGGDAVTFDLDRPGRPPSEVFSGGGRFSGLAWAPDGRWLLLVWPTADQWLFVPQGDGRVKAVAGVASQFSPGSSARRHRSSPAGAARPANALRMRRPPPPSPLGARSRG